LSKVIACRAAASARLSRFRPRQPVGPVGVDERVVEQAEVELRPQQASHGVVDRGLSDATLPHLGDQRRVRLDVGQLDVHRGGEGAPSRFPDVGGDVMDLAELRDGEPVGDDHPVEPPLPAQHVVQQPPVGVGRKAVHLVVRRHHAPRASLLDRDFKGVEKHIPQRALPVGRWADVRP